MVRQGRCGCSRTGWVIQGGCCVQAMDRAHRLGQKRTVNVYRLLVRATLEEHIMGLQRFKLDVAGAHPQTSILHPEV